MNDPIWLSHISFKWVAQFNHQLVKYFPAGCQRWLVCFKSDGLDDGTRGGRLPGWCCGNRGVRVSAVVEMNTPLKLILVLGMFKLMIMFFEAKGGYPLKTNMTMGNAQLEDGFPIETWEFFFVMLVFRNVCTKTISRSFPGEGWDRHFCGVLWVVCCWDYFFFLLNSQICGV